MSHFLETLLALALAAGPAQEPDPSGDPSAAVTAAESEHGPDSPELADALHALGAQLGTEGDYRGSVEALERCIAIRDSLPGASLAAADALVTLAEGQMKLGLLDEAGRSVQRVIEIRERELGPDAEASIRAKNYLGVLQLSRGDSRTAVGLFGEALRRLEELHGPASPEITDVLGNYAYALTETGRAAEALEVYGRLLEVEVEVFGERSADVARTRSNLSRALYQTNDDRGERRELELAVDIAEEVHGPDHPRTLIFLRMLADSYLRTGQYLEAAPQLKRAWEGLMEQLGPGSPEAIYAGEAYVDSLRQLERYDEALETAAWVREQYGKTFGPEHPYTLDAGAEIGLTLWKAGRVEEALVEYEPAVQTLERLYGERGLSGDLLNALGHIYQTVGRLEDALRTKERAFALAQRNGKPVRLLSGLAGNLASLHVVMGNDREAWGYLRYSIETDFEFFDDYAGGAAEWEGSLNAKPKEWYLEMAMSVARRLGDPAVRREAFDALLRWKGRVGRRVGLLRAGVRARLDERGAEWLDDLRSVQGELALALHDRASRADGEALLSRRSDLERTLLEGANVSLEGLDVTAAEIQAALPPDAVAIDFFVHDEYGLYEDRHEQDARGFGLQPKRLVAWILPPSGDLELVDLGQAYPIQQAVQEYLGSIGTGTPTRGLALGRALDTDVLEPGRRARVLLWDPIVAHLDGAERVVVSADGWLAGLPLEILPTDEGEFLVESHAFVYQPSLTGLAAEPLERPASADRRDLLSVGGVDYGSGESASWARLSASGPEARDVAARARSIPGATVTELSGAQAASKAFVAEAPRHRWIHVATHGFANEEVDERYACVAELMPGLLTGLVFAGANRSPAGLLTAEQVAWLDLSGCELVVLSACNTALGERRTGDELVSLQRAFRLAGARTIVASLWSVDDASTRELMGAFYDGLWRRGLPRHEALRAAQLAMIRSDRERGVVAPSRWGAFVVSGQW